MRLSSKGIKFTLFFLLWGLLAFKQGDIVELEDYLNGRSGAYFYGHNNVEFVVAKGTHGEVLETKRLKYGVGIKIRIENGKHARKEAWVYYSYKNPKMILYKDKKDLSVAAETKKINEAKAVKTTQAQIAVREDPAASALQEASNVNEIVADTKIDPNKDCDPATTQPETVDDSHLAVQELPQSSPVPSPLPLPSPESTAPMPVDLSDQPVIDPVLYPPQNPDQFADGCKTMPAESYLNGPRNSLHVESNSTSTSSIALHGKFLPDTSFVMVTATNEATGKVQKEVLPVKNCTLETKEYFPDGPGKYKLQFYTTTSTVPFSTQTTYTTALNDPSSDMEVTNLDSGDKSYLLPTRMAESDDPGIIALSQNIIAKANAQTDMEKAKALHDWMGNNVEYDVKNFHNGNYQNIIYDASSVVRAQPKPRAICQGYSLLYAALARASGLRTRVVLGQIIWSDPCPVGSSQQSQDPKLPTFCGQTWEKDGQRPEQAHAWNEVLVDGQWVTVDSTWDAGSPNFSNDTFQQSLSEKYFNPDSDFFAKTHHRTESSDSY